MTTNPFDETMRLLDQAQAQADRLGALSEALQRPGTESVTGTDESGLISVRLSGSGQIEDVVLDEHWREDLGEDALGPAVQRALDDAVGHLLVVRSNAAEDADAEVGASLLSDEVAPADVGHPGSRASVEAAEHLLDLLQAATAELDQLDAALAAAPAATSHASPDRSVAVQVQAQRVTSIEVDQRWLRNTPDGRVEQALVRAVSEALAKPEPEPDPRARFEALSEITRATSDPDATLRNLGLLR